MAGKKRRELAPALARAEERFRVWRRKRKPGDRIPDPLWAAAVKLALVHGISRTSSTLGLDYYSLKERLESVHGEREATAGAFIELPAPAVLSKQCTIALDNGTGATMRVCLTSYDAADIATLARSIWSGD